MKIISGEYKGRSIEGFLIEGTRPTMDRVKESLFSMIQDYIKGSICLDLFAGSGNLGLEALSNGAQKCYFNDVNNKCCFFIKKNITKFNISQEKYEISNDDYQKCLKKFDANHKLNIIFLDPPYAKECLNDVITFICTNNLLANDGLIICEIANDYLNDNFNDLTVYKKRQYGDKLIIIFKKV